MHYSRRVLLSLGLTSTLLPEDKADAKKATLQGRVINAVTEETIQDAKVTLVPPGAPVLTPGAAAVGEISVLSDIEGNFTFKNVAPGTYSLSAQKTEFEKSDYAARTPGTTGTLLTVAAGQLVKELSLKLVPQGSISGRVFDDKGEPVSRASVQVFRERMLRGKRQWMIWGGRMSDDDGSYRLPRMPPAKYIIGVTPPTSRTTVPRLDPQNPQPETSLVRVYYPGVNEPSQAQKLSLGPGSELGGYNLWLRQDGVVRVRCTVIDGITQTPVKHALVALLRRDAPTFGVRRVSVRNKRGEFEFANVEPGTYDLWASVVKGPEEILMATAPVSVIDRSVDLEVVLTLDPCHSIEGSVVLEAEPKANLEAMRITLIPPQVMAVVIDWEVSRCSCSEESFIHYKRRVSPRFRD